MSAWVDADTIVAQATPLGVGGVGIIRISGPLVPEWIPLLCHKQLPPRQAIFSSFYNKKGELLDRGVAIYFPAPHSFTGEPVLELQGHGGIGVMLSLQEAVCELGGRLAQPGEFSQRAFLNGKIDLVQAEAVADLIHAGTRQAAKAALNSLQGVFSHEISSINQAIQTLRVLVEANIDFSEEDIDIVAEKNLLESCRSIQDQLETLLHHTQKNRLFNEGIRIAIVGFPNAGKSSLLNALAEEDVAIVTEKPGTTRDIIRQTIQVAGIPVQILDTAGLRETACDIEQVGIARAKAAAQQVDIILWIHDEAINPFERKDLLQVAAFLQINLSEHPCIVVLNKQDITGLPIGRFALDECPLVRVSVKEKSGIDSLKDTILQVIGIKSIDDCHFTARERHVELLRIALTHIQEALNCLEAHTALEIVAEELSQSHKALCKITGEFGVEALLGEIFSTFCIGK